VPLGSLSVVLRSATTVAAVLLLLVASPARARWAPPSVLAPAAVPRAVVADVAGGVTLFASGRRSARYTWPAAGGRPAMAPLPRFLGGYLFVPWEAKHVWRPWAADRAATW
jgi:hypothetical protein